MSDSLNPYLTVVIPAYNEEFRLPATLDKIFKYFENVDYSYEIIVVDDGSTDKTSKVVQENPNYLDKLKLIAANKNYGKGYAVKLGIEQSAGDYVVFYDADGATPIEEIEKLLDVINNGADIAIGSRALKQSAVDDLWHRRLRGQAFNLLIKLILMKDFDDTQCGFKLFKTDLAKNIFSKLVLIGYSFDVEVLFLAKLMKLKVGEVPIRWNAIPGTKLNPFIDPLLMLLAVVKVKLIYLSGRYKI
ncbi:MAG: dolichyl-phosphate beta-glucosyltransferase [Vampirovibrionia bacterium]